MNVNSLHLSNVKLQQMLRVERYQQRLEGLKFKVAYQSLLEGINEVTIHSWYRDTPLAIALFY